MKKIAAIILSFTLLLGISSPAFASENDDIEKALQLIEKTNREIDEKVAKAVAEADELQADYLREIQKLEEGDKIVKFKEDREKIISELSHEKNDEGKAGQLNEKLVSLSEQLVKEQARINEKVQEVQKDINELTVGLVYEEDKNTKRFKEKLERLERQLKQKSDKYDVLTEKFTEKLDKIIEDVYNETLAMSAKTIEKAAKLGVTAECSWTLVRFADRWVWIDPLRVVKVPK